MICRVCALAADSGLVMASHVDCEGGCDCHHRPPVLKPRLRVVYGTRPIEFAKIYKAGQCAHCLRNVCLYPNGTVVVHKRNGSRCEGSKRRGVRDDR